MMEKVKLGVLGYGSIGSVHCANVTAGKVPQMELTAICDISEKRREAAQKLYPGIKVYSHAEDFFKSCSFDAVIVSTPHYEHPGLVMEALSYGYHVITEKPAGVYTKQVLEMNEAAKRSNKLFGIMYNQRTNPVYQKIRKMVTSGELGAIKRVSWVVTDWYRPQSYHDSSTWRSTWKGEGGGTLINQNPHQIDLWQWMFGMPDRITAFASFGKYYNIEVEDDVTAYFEYKNGMTGTYITSTGEAPGTNRLEIACDMGKIVVENDQIVFHRNVISEREFNRNLKSGCSEPECWRCEIPTQGRGEQHAGILKNFANAVLTGEELLAPGEEGISGLTISNAMHYSAWTGKTVDVKNFPHDEFYALLQEKINNSTIVKEEGVQMPVHTKY